MTKEEANDATKNTSIDDLLNDPFQSTELENQLTTGHTGEESQENGQLQTYNQLSEDRQEQANQMAAKIDTSDLDSVLNYGANAQEKIGNFSQNVLSHVQSQDTGHIGKSLNELMGYLNDANPSELRAEDSNIFKKIFNRINRSIYEITAKYQKIGAQIDRVSKKLDNEKQSLLKDNEMLKELYDQNLDFYEALNVYIGAGELRINELETELIPNALEEANQAQDQMMVQQVNDLEQFKSRLEKRVHDLRLARQITIQQAPQIRLIQNTNQALAEKIQTSINTAIPLWKNQVVIALTLLRQKEAITAQRQVSETTNDMLTKNSELLKQSSIETARENERGVVDIETLEKTQADLIETLEETLVIQQEGKAKRTEAQARLTTMEDQLKDQLLQLSNRD